MFNKNKYELEFTQFYAKFTHHGRARVSNYKPISGSWHNILGEQNGKYY